MGSIRPSSGPSARPAIAGASVLFVFGLLAAASIDPFRPAVRETRETQGERASVRELTATLAKAVRSLVETASQRPVASLSVRVDPWEKGEAFVATLPPEAAGLRSSPPRLRHALLDLPPPAAA